MTTSMTEQQSGQQWSTSFAGASLAAMRAYDQILARLFTPWVDELIDRLAPQPGATALDIATGPGTVAHVLARHLGRTGRIIATDHSPAMLEIARGKPVDSAAATIDWLDAPAAPIPLPDASVDLITCQQGLQFFPDKSAALVEMRRLLRPGGRAGIAVWTRVEDQIFGYLRDAIRTTVSPEVASRYLGPFLLAGEAAANHARAAGFEHVALERVRRPAVLPGGARDLIDTLPAAGIASDIAALDDAQRAALLAEVTRLTEPIRDGDRLVGSMTSSVLILS
jgi:ubiquinone/menaquinone biosynthesis C-methylase UbiE